MDINQGGYRSMDFGGSCVFSTDFSRERQRLACVIRLWNSKCPDLFKISEPGEDLVFHGVVRFYLHDLVTGSCATKCIRISSTTAVKAVVETLLEKTRLDMRTPPASYSMYEVLSDEEERKLGLTERPLMVQLRWAEDNRDARFILRDENGKNLQSNSLEGNERLGVIQTFKRTLSKKGKKKEKKKSGLNIHTPNKDEEFSFKTHRSTANLHAGRNKNMKQTKSDKEMENCGEFQHVVLCHARQDSGCQFEANTFNHTSCASTTSMLNSPRRQDRMYMENITPKNTLPGQQDIHFQNERDNTNPKWGLPLSIKLKDTYEEAFLCAVVNYTNSSTVHFKLSPAYAFYLAARFLLSHRENKNSSPNTACRVISFVNKIVHTTGDVIQRHKGIAVALAFWMANISELLNFLRHDRDLSPITLHAQDAMGHLVQKAFKYLSHRLQTDLDSHMPAFLLDADEQSTSSTGIDGVLSSLTRAMGVLRRCRVNPALSIQLFSQLFHFMAVWLLNRLTGHGVESQGLCCQPWGMTLRQRLSHVEAWAERQGLELAADCHLSRIIQATGLLSMNTFSMNDTQEIHSTCFKLNSLQLRALMTNYRSPHKQQQIPCAVIDRVIALAEISADDMLRKEGKDIRVEEDAYLRLPFLLPEEGYSCDSIQGTPSGFQEFLEPICRKGLCTLILNPFSVGTWTIFFNTSESVPSEKRDLKPVVVKITLKKPLHSGIGVSIVAAKGVGQDQLGIFIKSVVRGGPAHVDGRLTTGDQLLSVDSISLVGLSQERAADILLRTGRNVTLEIAKLGAVYYGIGDVLNQLPQMTAKDPSIVEGALQQSNNHSKDDSIDPHTADHKKRQNPKWLKHRSHRSIPDLANSLSNSDEMSIHSVMSEKRTKSASTYNLSVAEESATNLPDFGTNHTLAYQREYLTLPTRGVQTKRDQEEPELCHNRKFSQEPDHMKSLKHAYSQECLNVERGQPLVDKPPPFRSQPDLSKSENHAHSYKLSQDKESRSGHWQTPVAIRPLTLSQPKRIDMPISRPANPQTNPQSQPSLILFNFPTNLAADRRGTSQVSEKQHCQHQKQQGCTDLPSQPLPLTNIATQRAALGQITERQPTAQILQTPFLLQGATTKRSTSQHTVRDTIEQPGGDNMLKSRELSAVEGGLSPNPWAREAQEQLKREQQNQAVDLLEQEVLQLQEKVERTLVESDRLRRLSLEWQFQKRLQEFQQNGDDDEDDEEVNVERQQSVIVSSAQIRGLNDRHEHLLREDHRQQAKWKESQLSATEETKDMTADGSPVPDNSCGKLWTLDNQGNKILQNLNAPEMLTFRERQQLFSVAQGSANKVSVL